MKPGDLVRERTLGDLEDCGEFFEEGERGFIFSDLESARSMIFSLSRELPSSSGIVLDVQGPFLQLLIGAATGWARDTYWEVISETG